MKFIAKMREYSFNTILQIVLLRIFNTQIMKIHYLKNKIEPDTLSKQFYNLQLNFKELTYEDFLMGDKNVFRDGKLQIIKERFNDSTYKAYGILENDTLIYSAWISLVKLGLPVKSSIKLLPHEGYLEDDYCHPLYRGQGIHSKMLIYRMMKLYEYGKSECIVTVLDGNKPALNSQLKLGARDVGCFYAGKILGIPFVKLNKKKYDSR